MRSLVSFLAALLLLSACSSKKGADLLVYNATIYTVDSAFSTAEAMVVRDGKILATGTRSELEKSYRCRETLDAGGRFVYPGFYDAHAHFVNYGLGLQQADLTGTQSWEECLQRLQEFKTSRPRLDGQWIIGRGWDQNDWTEKYFPEKTALDTLFPDHPVLLTRVDGHAAIANQRALDLAGIKAGDTLTGGSIEEMEGSLTGILIDNAIDRVSARIPAPDTAQIREALRQAQENCFAMGITSVADCGLHHPTVELLQALEKEGSLLMRMFIMLSDDPSNYAWAEKNGPVKTDRLRVNAIKVYGDGALGSRGACLLQPYHDKPGHHGFLLSRPEHFDSVAAWCLKNDWQLCTHAIGDSGNRTILSIYEKHLKGKNDKRWRIEHAQVVNAADFIRFGLSSVIPSVQPTHATSDMYWAGDRLGPERVKGAYAYRQLLEQNGWLPLGTDFPVEDISPFKTFLASVFRTDAKGWPDGGYQAENALSREQTLRGMTSWAARAGFEENEKGSLEKGKWADFIILDRDLMKVPATELLQTRVLYTYLAGRRVFAAANP